MKKSTKRLPKISSSEQQLFGVSVVLLALSIIVLVVTLVTQHHSTNPVLTPFKLGQSITDGSANVTVSKVAYVTTGPQLPKGMQYVIVTLEVKNVSQKTITLLPTEDTYVKDTSGAVSYLSPYGLDAPFRAGELLAGDQLKGQLSYLTAKNAKLTFYVDSIWSGQPIPIALQ